MKRISIEIGLILVTGIALLLIGLDIGSKIVTIPNNVKTIMNK